MIPEPVEPAAVETSAASDETVFAEAGLAASSRLGEKGKMMAVYPNARVAMAALAEILTRLTRLHFEQDQSSHVRDTEADCDQ